MAAPTPLALLKRTLRTHFLIAFGEENAPDQDYQAFIEDGVWDNTVIAKRKCLNPLKWAEFLILISWYFTKKLITYALRIAFFVSLTLPLVCFACVLSVTFLTGQQAFKFVTDSLRFLFYLSGFLAGLAAASIFIVLKTIFSPVNELFSASRNS